MAWNNLAGVGNLLATLGQLQGVGNWQQKGGGKGKGAHKGGGKAKGKGKGQGHGKGTEEAQRSFQCLWDDCKAACTHKETWDSSHCHCCERYKGVAKSPPLERLTTWAFEARCKDKAAASTDGNTDKNKDTATPPPRSTAAVAETERLAELRADRLAGLKAGSGTGSTGSPPAQSSGLGKPTVGSKKVGSTLDEGALESAPLIAKLIQPVLTSVAGDWITEVPIGLDPEEGLKAVLQSSSNLTAADGREALEASLAESQKMLLTATAPSLKKVLQSQIDADTAALEKSAKKATPSLATQLAALQEAEKKLLMLASERRDKEVLGRQKAMNRSSERAQFFINVREELAKVEAAVLSHEAQWSAMHVAKSQTLDGHDKAMLARLQTRMVAAESGNSISASAQAAAAEAKKAATATQDAAKARKTAEDTAAEAAAQHADLLQKYQVLQQQAAKAEDLQKQALALQQAELVFVTADVDMIPAEVAPKTGAKAFWKICGHLFQLMERWHLGGNIAVSLAELNLHSLAKDDTQSLMKKLLGTELWNGWFGATDFTMAADSVLPRQLMTYLHVALRQLKEHYEAGEGEKTAAGKAYALLAEASAKKRKVAQ